MLGEAVVRLSVALLAQVGVQLGVVAGLLLREIFIVGSPSPLEVVLRLGGRVRLEVVPLPLQLRLRDVVVVDGALVVLLDRAGGLVLAAADHPLSEGVHLVLVGGVLDEQVRLDGLGEVLAHHVLVVGGAPREHGLGVEGLGV